VSDPSASPAAFRHAVATLSAVRPRPELVVTAVDAPPRLAPHTWAVGVEADAARQAGEDLDEPDTSGRLILLHDPAGQDAWEGTFRLVCFVQARLDPEQVGDEMLPRVGWSWLTEALEQHGAAHVALGGTVTQTSSVRFGDIAGAATPKPSTRSSPRPPGCRRSAPHPSRAAPSDTCENVSHSDRPVTPKDGVGPTPL
jgi:hypothetical protein